MEVGTKYLHKLKKKEYFYKNILIHSSIKYLLIKTNSKVISPKNIKYSSSDAAG